MPEADLDQFLALALRLADAAGAEIRPHFRNLATVEEKPDQTPVTVADREAETLLRTTLLGAFPEDGAHAQGGTAAAREIGEIRPFDAQMRGLPGEET